MHDPVYEVLYAGNTRKKEHYRLVRPVSSLRDAHNPGEILRRDPAFSRDNRSGPDRAHRFSLDEADGKKVEAASSKVIDPERDAAGPCPLAAPDRAADGIAGSGQRNDKRRADFSSGFAGKRERGEEDIAGKVGRHGTPVTGICEEEICWYKVLRSSMVNPAVETRDDMGEEPLRGFTGTLHGSPDGFKSDPARKISS